MPVSKNAILLQKQKIKEEFVHERPDQALKFPS